MKAETLRSIEGIGMPLLVVGGLIGSTVFIMVNVAGYFSDLKAETTKYRTFNDARVTSIEKSVAGLVTSVKDLTLALSNGTESRYKRDDFIRDCLAMAVLNENWNCPYGPKKPKWTYTIEKK